ncbi:hypothetical protein MVEN_00595400 [Mycena venus]|uniref:Uncharacterized protein n=1 Tax=Mycena venus TaxID=2733690 RepID=A0A8H6YNY4_9AGAR|nr:hypothetical protein MVEN_00595400 [Mycena venus]
MPPPDPREIHGLVNDATSHTSRLIAFFIEISAMLHTPEIAKNANVCAAVHNCLETIPGVTEMPTKYMPPEDSSWRTKRRGPGSIFAEKSQKIHTFFGSLAQKAPSSGEIPGRNQ